MSAAYPLDTVKVTVLERPFFMYFHRVSLIAISCLCVSVYLEIPNLRDFSALPERPVLKNSIVEKRCFAEKIYAPERLLLKSFFMKSSEVKNNSKEHNTIESRSFLPEKSTNTIT
jgi:hypothetical protein